MMYFHDGCPSRGKSAATRHICVPSLRPERYAAPVCEMKNKKKTGQNEGESEETKIATARVKDGCEATGAVSASRRAPRRNLGLA